MKQCLITQRRLPYDSIVPRPCAVVDVRNSFARRMASMMCVYPLGADPPRASVYICRHSQKGTRSPRANDCALPVGVSRVTRAWVARGEPFSASSTLEYPVRGRQTWVSCPPSSVRRSSRLVLLRLSLMNSAL